MDLIGLKSIGGCAVIEMSGIVRITANFDDSK